MRGRTTRQATFTAITPDQKVPRNHPIRRIRALVEPVLKELSPVFEEMYAVIGRPSIPPEHLLKATLLMTLYSVRSERQFCERLEYDLLFKWFMDLNLEDPAFDASTFSKNRGRLLEQDVAGRFMQAVLEEAGRRRLLSEEHFTVDGTLLEAWASLKSFRPRDEKDPPPGAGRNPERDFRGQPRKNGTHVSTTDAEARLYTKSSGQAAKLCFIAHGLMENRSRPKDQLLQHPANSRCLNHGRRPLSFSCSAYAPVVSPQSHARRMEREFLKTATHVGNCPDGDRWLACDGRCRPHKDHVATSAGICRTGDPITIGFEAYLRNDAGSEITPADREDWRGWVSASRTRNWCRKDPLLDWLNLHGQEKGYERDPEPDPRTDFLAFVFRKGHEFETAVVRHLATIEEVFPIAAGVEAVMSLEACRETFEAMRRGEPIIHQGVLRNPENRTYGAADLLIRSDVLRRLFPDALGASEATLGAPGLGATSWHYRVVDAKFTGLKLDRNWHAASEHLEYMTQVFLYNTALARIQGYVPPRSYLLGRGWTKGKHEAGGTNCMDASPPCRTTTRFSAGY